MKKKATIFPKVMYSVIALLVVAEVWGAIQVVTLLHNMMSPDSEGFLLSNEEFNSMRTMRLAYLIGMIIASVPVFFVVVVKGEISNLSKNLLSSAYSLFILLFIAEGAFMYYVKSDAVGLRFSHNLWVRLHWRSYTPYFDNRNQPMQLRGTEDYSWAKNSKKKIFVVGDSFCAGDGVEEDKMFSSILSTKLPACQVVNICERGADPKRELENLYTLSMGLDSLLPNILIWEYYGNDIEAVAQGHQIIPIYPPLTSFQNFGEDLMKGKSFLLDYIYWEIINPDNSKEYMAFLEKAYNNTSVIKEHLFPIEQTIKLCAQNNIPMVVVIFPFLGDIPKAQYLYSKAFVAFLQTKGVKVIDVSLYLNEMPVLERMVHKSNPHPSEKVHAIVAEKILEALH